MVVLSKSLVQIHRFTLHLMKYIGLWYRPQEQGAFFRFGFYHQFRDWSQYIDKLRVLLFMRFLSGPLAYLEPSTNSEWCQVSVGVSTLCFPPPTVCGTVSSVGESGCYAPFYQQSIEQWCKSSDVNWVDLGLDSTPSQSWQRELIRVPTNCSIQMFYLYYSYAFLLSHCSTFGNLLLHV